MPIYEENTPHALSHLMLVDTGVALAHLLYLVLYFV